MPPPRIFSAIFGVRTTKCVLMRLPIWIFIWTAANANIKMRGFRRSQSKVYAQNYLICKLSLVLSLPWLSWISQWWLLAIWPCRWNPSEIHGRLGKRIHYARGQKVVCWMYRWLAGDRSNLWLCRCFFTGFVLFGISIDLVGFENFHILSFLGFIVVFLYFVYATPSIWRCGEEFHRVWKWLSRIFILILSNLRWTYRVWTYWIPKIIEQKVKPL